MSTFQRMALAAYREMGLGALRLVGYGWVWPEDLRRSPALAEAVVWRLAARPVVAYE